MREIRTTLLGLMLLNLVGCAVDRHAAEIQVVGFVAKAERARSFCFVDLKETWVDSRPAVRMIEPFTMIETRDIIKLQVANLPQQNFTVYLGPAPADDRMAKGWVENSVATMHLWHGWVYIGGRQPMAATPYVAAGADGSTIVAQIADPQSDPSVTEEVHRIYFLEGKKAWAKNNAGDVREFEKTETYIEVDAQGHMSGPFPIAGSGAVESFINYVKAAVAAG